MGTAPGKACYALVTRAAARRIQPAAQPSPPSAAAEAFYAEVLRELDASGIPFLVGGSYALAAYTGLRRKTKDLDVSCKNADFRRVLDHFAALGFETEVEDACWIGKVKRGDLFADVIFASERGLRPVDDTWFEHACRAEVLGTPALLIAPTELLWQKCYIQLRHRHDGPDVMHLILRAGDQIAWPRLLARMGEDWEVLLAQLVLFRWTYPGERDRAPRWLVEELTGRLRGQLGEAPPEARLCRGPKLSRFDYEQDIAEWGYADPVAAGNGHHG